VYLIKPLSYFESLKLAKDAAIVLTDSGGLQKEAFVLGTPVVTMRRTTEWIETVKCGWNIITNCNKEKILNGIRKFLDNKPEPVNAVTLYGDGKASQRITNITKKFLEQIGVE
jgi:UDP-N-acetylglucosamine 2-epimerase